MPVYYPSARVRLVLRFDEGADTGALRQAMERSAPPPDASTTLPAETEELLATLRDELSQILRQRGLMSADEYEHRLSEVRRRRDAAQQATSRSTLPAAISAPPPDGRTVIGNVLPLQCSIQRNGLRMADTASVTISHRDAPFDPRAIRSAAVEITMGTVSAEDFSRGGDGQRREDGSLYSVVPRVPAESPPAPGTTRFIGFVDEWSVDRGEGDTVELTCRDLSALPMDQKLPPGLGVDVSLPIDRAISNLLDEFASMRGTTVVWAGTGASPSLEAATPRSRQPRRGGRQTRARAGGENMTVWEHIVETCVQVGVIPVFEDSVLKIIDPRTHFTGGRARVLIYGRNLKKLTFSRKMGGTLVPTIEVRAYDPRIGRTRWARWPVDPGSAGVGVFGQTDPPRATRPSLVAPSGVAEDKILTFTLQATDPDAMLRAAESLWNEVGRKEIEGTVETHDLAAWIRPDDTTQPIHAQEQSIADLLTMQAGDAVELLVASIPPNSRSPHASSTELESLSAEARAQYLERLGWSREVAERFAQLQDATAQQTVFRVQHVELKFDSSTGIAISADFINFLEVREMVR